MRSLNEVHLVAMGVNAIVGAGIFMLPGHLAESMGIYSVAVFALCGLLLNFVALSFAQLSRLTDRNGGPYLYSSLAFGPRIGFLVGWTAWICAIVSCGAVGNAIGFYLSHFFIVAPDPVAGKLSAALAILLFGGVNYFGVSHGGRAMLGLTILKIIPLLALAVGGMLVAITGWNPTLPAGSLITSGFSGSMMMALFTCQGFEVVPIIAGETKNPMTSVPRAILTSLWISVILYCLIQVGIVMGPAVGSSKPLADQAQFLWGSMGGTTIALAGLISVIGFVAGTALGAPRFLSPLCEDGLLPETLSAIHPKYHTPTRAILLTTTISVFFALLIELRALIALSALSVALQYFISSIALIRLSKTAKARRFSGFTVGTLATLVSIFFLYQIPLSSWIIFCSVSLAGLTFHLAYQLTVSKEVLSQGFLQSSLRTSVRR